MEAAFVAAGLLVVFFGADAFVALAFVAVFAAAFVAGFVAGFLDALAATFVDFLALLVLAALAGAAAVAAFLEAALVAAVFLVAAFLVDFAAADFARPLGRVVVGDGPLARFAVFVLLSGAAAATGVGFVGKMGAGMMDAGETDTGVRVEAVPRPITADGTASLGPSPIDGPLPTCRKYWL